MADNDLIASLYIDGAYEEHTIPMKFGTSDAVTRLNVGNVTYVTSNDVTSVRCPVMGIAFENWTTKGILC